MIDRLFGAGLQYCYVVLGPVTTNLVLFVIAWFALNWALNIYAKRLTRNTRK